MKPRLMDFLRCPLDRTPLELVEWEAKAVSLNAQEAESIERLGAPKAAFDREIVEGVLVNRARNLIYPVLGGVPRMLTFPNPVFDAFRKRHAKRIAADFPGHAFPSGAAEEGERETFKSFSAEWVNYDWNEDAYWNMDADTHFQAVRWLLDLDHKTLAGSKVLEVGIGIGGTADRVSRDYSAEVFGLDLSMAVDPAFRNFGRNRFLHIVQASLFHPPFEDGVFDFVYSDGVLHHTYSTKAAFHSIARLPRPGGRLYVWVYHYDPEHKGLLRMNTLENIVRPVCSRLPAPLQTAALLPLLPMLIAYQNWLGPGDGSKEVRFGFREALHSARDWFTPRFAYRHTAKELVAWFEEAGYTPVRSIQDETAPPEVPRSLARSTGVEGERVAAKVPVRRAR